MDTAPVHVDGQEAEGDVKSIGYKNILVNLDDALKVVRTYRSGDLHHERAQRATYSSETLENGSGYSR